jgi:hypothetical protein
MPPSSRSLSASSSRSLGASSSSGSGFSAGRSSSLRSAPSESEPGLGPGPGTRSARARCAAPRRRSSSTLFGRSQSPKPARATSSNGRPTAMTSSEPTSPRTGLGCGRPTTASGSCRRTGTSSSRRRSPMGRSTWLSRRGGSSRSTPAPARLSGLGTSTIARPPRPRSATGSSTRRSCINCPAVSTRPGRRGSSSPGTLAPATSSGESTRGLSSRRRFSSGTGSTSARGITVCTRTTFAAASGLACAGPSGRTTRSSRHRRTRTAPSSSRQAAGPSTESTRVRAGSAGTRRPSHASGAASTSTRLRRSPTAACSSATQTARCTPSGRRPGTCSGLDRSGPTCTQRRLSGGRLSSLAPGTATSWRSTREPETFAGATALPRRSPARRRSSRGSSTSRRAGDAGSAVCGG